MNECFLICEKGQEEGKIFSLTRENIQLGRGGENDIIVQEMKVSRRHSRIKKEGEKVQLIDLKSGNGTWLNGRKIEKEFLKNGDKIKIGDTVFRFESEIKKKDEKVAPEKSDGTRIIIKPLKDLMPEKHKEITKTKETTRDVVNDVKEEIKEIDKKEIVQSDIKRFYKNLLLIHRVSHLLGFTPNLDELLQNIVEIIVEVMQVERAVLLIRENGKLKEKAVRTSSLLKEHGCEVKISQTILNKVVNERAGIITGDAVKDSRFQESGSIIMQKIHSAMCVPLLSKTETLGAIYVDSAQMVEMFSETELKTLASLASEASIAIENFNLLNRIKEETLMKERLQRYLSPNIVEEVIKGKETLSLGGVRKKVSVLFADIRGFTALSEKLSAEEVVEMLNEFFTLMIESVFKYGGTLDKFIGDAIMAVFGTPIEYKDDAFKAVKCAIEMQKTVKKFNEKRRQKDKIELNVGIGINTGEAVAGNMGSPERMDYTVIGDVINTASRIVSLAPAGVIYINESVYREVENEIKAKKIEPVKVKGKIKLLNLFSVIIDENLSAG